MTDRERIEMEEVILSVFDDPNLAEITDVAVADALIGKGYRRSSYVAENILDSVLDFILAQGCTSDPAVADIYHKVLSLRDIYVARTLGECVKRRRYREAVEG